MSTTQRQTEIEKYLKESAECTSQALYNKPFAELDEERRRKVMAGAYRELKNTVLYDPQPGTCFSCGRGTTFKREYQCWRCHEGVMPSQKQLW